MEIPSPRLVKALGTTKCERGLDMYIVVQCIYVSLSPFWASDLDCIHVFMFLLLIDICSSSQSLLASRFYPSFFPSFTMKIFWHILLEGHVLKNTKWWNDKIAPIDSYRSAISSFCHFMFKHHPKFFFHVLKIAFSKLISKWQIILPVSLL